MSEFTSAHCNADSNGAGSNGDHTNLPNFKIHNAPSTVMHISIIIIIRIKTLMISDVWFALHTAFSLLKI